MKKTEEWKLTDIFENEKAYQSCKEELQKMIEKIGKKEGYLTKTAKDLLETYHLYEKALELYEKVYAYGMLNYHLDMASEQGIKLFKEVENIGTYFREQTAYIKPEMLLLEENKLKAYMQEEVELQRYENVFKRIEEEKKHTLSKEAENLLANFTQVFSAPENIFDILTNTEFKFGMLKNEAGEEVILTDATYSNFMKSKDESVRKEAFQLMYHKYSEFNHTLAEIYLSTVREDTVESKVRKYASSLEKAVIEDDATTKVYQALMETVHEHLYENHQFMRIKKQLLKQTQMHMYDVYVNPFSESTDTISFEEAKQEVLEALAILGEEYQKKLQEAFDNHWIDAYERENKRGGAYSMGVYGIHPFVLMNFVNSKRDVSTIAHELGHSMHSNYANNQQNVIDANYTIMVAEVASTVNEILLAEYQIKQEKDSMKKAEIIYELLEMIRATFYRQSMFAEFEKQIHEEMEAGNLLAAEDLNSRYYQLNKQYFGEAIVVDELIQYEWSRIPHFYTPFYVYKYATGISCAISIAMSILEEKEGYKEKYIEMLKQGCCKKAVELLKMVDVDLESKIPYENTVKYYKQKMQELENIL
ncbi:MAG: oligoendopeptidase F [Clostridia bacterium]